MAFDNIREIVFPIYGRYEITKFLLLGGMKFFIIFVLTLTRDTKDTLIVTQCGAEAIAFLKVYGVLPAAATYIGIYAKMASNLSRKSLFYATCIPFFVFFIVFDYFLFPNGEMIQPSMMTVQSWFGKYEEGEEGGGGGSQVIIKIIANWVSALYFIVSEVYSSVSIGILFWKFANDIVSVQQAKRFYPLFAYMSSLAPIFAGQYVVQYASRASTFSISLRRITMAIFVSSMGICLLHHLINRFVETNNHYEIYEKVKTNDTDKDKDKDKDNDTDVEHLGTNKSINNNNTKKKEKPKLSMIESIRFLASSKYLGLMTILVVGYGLMYNFLEVSWKSLVKEKYSDKLEYQRFMGNFSSIVGSATLIVIFLGSNIIQILGWRIGALATPTIMCLVAIPFFTCTVFLNVQTSPNVLNASVSIGSLMILLSRSFKYGLFDPTTQMAYIPLDENSKVQGKAAIDVLGSRLGKSGASLIQQGLVLMFGDIIKAAPIIMFIFYSVSIAWIAAAKGLSVLYLQKTSMKKE